MVRDAGDSAFDVIARASGDSDLVLLGLRPPESDEAPEDYSEYYAQLLSNTDGLPATALVLAAEDIDFQRIFE